MENLICEAIQNRQVLRFRYDGGERSVEPYVYGETRTGVEVLRGYQTGGFSVSGAPEGWKLFRVAEIADLKADNVAFSEIRPDYRGEDPTITTVYCQIEETGAA